MDRGAVGGSGRCRDKDRVTIRRRSDSTRAALGARARWRIESADLIVVRRGVAEREVPTSGYRPRSACSRAAVRVCVAERRGARAGRSAELVTSLDRLAGRARRALGAAEPSRSAAQPDLPTLTVDCAVERLGDPVPEPRPPQRGSASPPRSQGGGDTRWAEGHRAARWLALGAMAADELRGQGDYGVIDLLFVGSPADGPAGTSTSPARSVRAAGLPGRHHPAYRRLTPRRGLQGARG